MHTKAAASARRPGSSPASARAAASAAAGVAPARSPACSATENGAAASSGTGRTGATTDLTPSPTRAVAVPTTSSPRATRGTAALHAGSTIVAGAAARRSRS